MITLEDMHKLVDCSKKAGDIAINLRKKGLNIEIKNDGTKVTNADKELDVLFADFIKSSINSKDLIISEEDVGNGNLPESKNGESFWSIDPIDSTTSFIKGYPYWTLNIAYVENGMPSFGLIHAPQIDTIWFGSVGVGAFKQIGNNKPTAISARKVPIDGAILISSEEQLTPREVRDELRIIQEIKMPSSIKFTYIAEGLADYYVRRRTKAAEWDISSGHGLILAAGGFVEFTNAEENFQYGKPPYKAPALLARGKI
jgi:3'(2'), 5'-bisphosphate nucleotidase